MASGSSDLAFQVRPPLAIAPAQVLRGAGILAQSGAAIAALGHRPLVVCGATTQALVEQPLQQLAHTQDLTLAFATYGADCSEVALAQLHQAAANHQADCIIGVGGGKALDAAKLLAHQLQVAIATVPTSAATCAAWTALSNIYSEQGAFQYDVPLPHCPAVLILDYDLVAIAPQRLLVAGIGDALAKWYEASVSSGDSTQALTIAAVQQARVLRDFLFQSAPLALGQPGSDTWQEVVDACVLLAGVMGGMGGAQCRTVAAHAVHNGLTHLTAAHDILHGEKVAYGILVQLRLEEMVRGNQLAASSRQQLIQFYQQIGLPCSLADLGLNRITITDLHQAATVACRPESDIHRLPFAVTVDDLMAAMVSTLAETSNPADRGRVTPAPSEAAP